MKLVNLSKLQNNELLGITDSTINLVDKRSDILPEKVLIRLKAVQDSYEEFRININNSKISTITQKITALDKQRNNTLREILREVRTGIKSSNNLRYNNAVILNNIVHGFGGFFKSKLDVKTAEIKSLIKDIKNNSISLESSNNLGISDLLTKLESCNKELDNLYLQRLSDKAAQDKFPAAKNNLIIAHKLLIKALDSASFLDEDLPSNKVLIDLYAIHANYQIAIEKRKHNKKSVVKSSLIEHSAMNSEAKSSEEDNHNQNLA